MKGCRCSVEWLVFCSSETLPVGVKTIYCPFHKAAPELLEACKQALAFVVKHYRLDNGFNLKSLLEDVIAKAESD